MNLPKLRSRFSSIGNGSRPARRVPRPLPRWGLLSAALLLIMLAASPARDQDSAPGQNPAPDPAALLTEASGNLRSGNYTAAIQSARKVRAASDDPAVVGRADFIIGYGEFKLKHHEPARQKLREASAAFPELSFHGLYYGALSYEQEEKYPEAVALWEKLLANSPPGDLTARALMELLRCHRRSEDHESAAKALARISAVSARSSDWDRELDFTRGWVKARQGAVAEARTIMIKLWRDYPDSFWAGQAEKLLTRAGDGSLLLPGEDSAITEGDCIQRVKKLIDISRAGQALDELKPIIEAAQKRSSKVRLASLIKLRAGAHEKKREFTNAIADYEKVRELLGTDDPEIGYNIAGCLRRSGRHQEALDGYRRIWTEHSKSAYATRALFYAARLMKLDNDWKGAEKTYMVLAGDYPHSTLRPEALFQIAWLRYLDHDHQKARAYLDRVPRMPRDDAFNARTLYWKAVMMRKLGDAKGAAALENKILEEYWDSNYAFYLVMVDGRKWPYPAGSKIIPQPDPNPPLEYKIARELYLLGLEDDAQGQLKSMESEGRLPEWLAWNVAGMHLDLGNYYASQRTAARGLGHRLKTPPPGEAEVWRLAYPRAYYDQVTANAKTYGLDPFLVWSLMRAESTYRPRIKSWAGAIGLMQVMPATGKQIARSLGDKSFKTSQLEDPATSIQYGCYYLGKRLEQFSDGGETTESRLKMITRALAAYNAGPERSKRWGDRADELGLPPAAFVEEIPIKETREYVRRILGFYLVYLTSYPREQVSEDNQAADEKPAVDPPG